MEGIASFLKPEGDPEAFLGKRVQGLVYTYEGNVLMVMMCAAAFLYYLKRMLLLRLLL